MSGGRGNDDALVTSGTPRSGVAGDAASPIATAIVGTTRLSHARDDSSAGGLTNDRASRVQHSADASLASAGADGRGRSAAAAWPSSGQQTPPNDPGQLAAEPAQAATETLSNTSGNSTTRLKSRLIPLRSHLRFQNEGRRQLSRKARTGPSTEGPRRRPRQSRPAPPTVASPSGYKGLHEALADHRARRHPGGTARAPPAGRARLPDHHRRTGADDQRRPPLRGRPRAPRLRGDGEPTATARAAGRARHGVHAAGGAGPAAPRRRGHRRRSQPRRGRLVPGTAGGADRRRRLRSARGDRDR